MGGAVSQLRGVPPKVGYLPRGCKNIEAYRNMYEAYRNIMKELVKISKRTSISKHWC